MRRIYCGEPIRIGNLCPHPRCMVHLLVDLLFIIGVPIGAVLLAVFIVGLGK